MHTYIAIYMYVCTYVYLRICVNKRSEIKSQIKKGNENSDSCKRKRIVQKHFKADYSKWKNKIK